MQSYIAGEMPEVSATPDIPAAMILEHLLIPLSTGVTGAQRSVDCSQHSPPASQGILHEVFAAPKEKVATMAPEKRHACL